MSVANTFMHSLIRKTLRPFVRLLLRYGVGYGDFETVVKRLFIEVADQDFRLENRKQTISRISVLTGITRREIKKILECPESAQEDIFIYNHAARILTHWLHDSDFHDSFGKPTGLSVNNSGPGSFDSLVKKHGNNTPTRAVLDELKRIGAVQVEDDDIAKMSSVGYVPSMDKQELLKVSFQSVADLLSTIDFNDSNETVTTRLQLSVNYDNVTDDGVDVFRRISREKCRELLLYLDRFLSTQDRDNNPMLDGEGTNRTGLGIFFFHENSEEKLDE